MEGLTAKVKYSRFLVLDISLFILIVTIITIIIIFINLFIFIITIYYYWLLLLLFIIIIIIVIIILLLLLGRYFVRTTQVILFNKSFAILKKTEYVVYCFVWLFIIYLLLFCPEN